METHVIILKSGAQILVTEDAAILVYEKMGDSEERYVFSYRGGFDFVVDVNEVAAVARIPVKEKCNTSTN